jgi:hypothetical protein
MTEARISIEESVDERLGVLGGTLSIDPSWTASSFRLVVTPESTASRHPMQLGASLTREDMVALPDEPHTWRWWVGSLPLGNYELQVLPHGYRRRIALGPEGLRDLSIVLPAPGLLRVLVVDRESQEPISVRALYWKHDDGRGAGQTGVGRPGELDSTASRFEMQVPFGWIELSVADARYRGSRLHTHVGPRDPPVRFEVGEASGLRVSLFDRGTPVVGLDMRPSAVSIAHAGRVSSWESQQGSWTAWFDEPGLYRIEIDAPTGYQPVPAREVEVVRGELTDCRIDLDRSR